MVDVPSVVMLTDTPAAFDAVPRLEDGWWPTGGAVDPANDNGLMNWAPQVLARRDRFLRNMIEAAGIGVAAVADVADFNAITLGGQYRGAAGATGAPAAGQPFIVNHMAGQSAGEAVQTAYGATDARAFLRRRTGGVWQAWQALWAGQEATGLIAATGWQRLPSGLILQWGGQTSIPANTTVTITLPVAFPNAVWRVFANRAAANSVGSANMGASGGTVSATQISLSTATDAGSSQSYHWLAIGG